jgi:thymidylate synthase (FAD)
VTDTPELPEIKRGRLYPFIYSPVFKTPQLGTPYLRQPGAVLVAAPQVDLSGLQMFLTDFGPELHFDGYLDDHNPLPAGTQLSKTAGQVCYASFGEKRTLNANADRYLDNIMSSGHGSVLEHANYSLQLHGISRSVSHEEVRHRHFAYSQLSQRYVSGSVLRFVERREFAAIPVLHERFTRRIDAAAVEYAEVTEVLLAEQKASKGGILSAEARTELRKKVRQTARDVLPNETETFMIVTGNIRAWRHFIAMRANVHADTAIREVAVSLYRLLNTMEPLLFADMTLNLSPIDNTYVVDVAYPKV